MKISEITFEDVVTYIREEHLLENDTDKAEIEKQLKPIMATAKSFISGYTGIKAEKVDEFDEDKTIDDYDDFYIVFMVLCQDMYDTRSLYIEKSNVNKTVSCILDMHRRNLL